MSFSINTNVASLSAQNYLRMNSNFQGSTINRVTSGLRIVQSGDDAAGLAIANGYRSDEAVLTQGVRNANDGLSQLQIVDGGMNNISQLIDRARTLATQSATGTFTGNRSVLNDEFKSVLGEIDRQSQAIGLDKGGIFAKSLSVFIGGGKTSTNGNAISNGSVGVDLSRSTVDAQSLGLKGVQALGNSAVDLSAAAATSVQNILANTTNKASESQAGYTTFVFSGSGFSDSNKISISVNLSSVNDPSTLVTAINSAISGAGSGASSAATAFKNAGISSSIVTDSSGKQHLGFSSSNATFQIGAADQTANALLGNVSTGSTGANLTTTVTASAALTAGGSTTATTVRFQGAGLTAPVDISVASGLTGAAAASALQTAVAASNTLKGAGISLTTTSGTLQFSSTSGQKFSVQAAGDTANVLGLGAFKAGASGAVDYNTITGATPTVTSTTTSTATVEFSLNGAASGGNSATVQTIQGAAVTAGTSGANFVDTTAGSAGGKLNLNVSGTNVAVDFTNDTNRGSNESLANIASFINSSVQTALGLAPGVNVVAADTTNHKLTFSPTAAGASSFVSVTGDASGTIGNSLGFATGSTFYAGPGTATAGTNLGTAVTAGTYATNGAGAAGILTLTVDGTAVAVDFSKDANVSATETGANVVKYINNTVRSALGLGSDVTVANFGGAGSALLLTSASTGTNSSAAVATGTIATALGLNATVTAGAGSTGNAVTISLSGGTATAAQGQGTAINPAAVIDTSAMTAVTITLDGVSSGVLDAHGAATDNLSGFATRLNGLAKAAFGTSQDVVTVVNNKLTFTSLTTGSNSSALVSGGAAYANVGLAGSGVALVQGSGPTVADIASRLNTAFSKNASFASADLQASVSTGTALTISSNNGSNFQLNETGAAGVSNLGFGITGASFAGNDSSIAPLTTPTVIANGAQQTSNMAFSGINNGGDAQLVTIASNDATGTQQSVGITLRNDSTGRNARNIDEAVSAINTALQQTNVASLQSIVAVKSDTNGTEGIVFTSASQPFNVSLNKTPNGTGFTNSGTTTAGVVGSGNTADISNQLGAQNAVTALAAAVSTLGSAQAVVGRGENTFNYAVNLAQSQLTNLATAESRIRDADLASEAANLTKAQILIQAGVAALAQANSAPQQVLSLLRG